MSLVYNTHGKKKITRRHGRPPFRVASQVASQPLRLLAGVADVVPGREGEQGRLILVAHAVQPVPRPVALLQLGVERGAGRTLVLLRVPGSAHVSRDKLTTSVTSIIQPPWPSGVHRKYPSGHVSGSGWNSESRQSSSVGVLQANSGEIIHM